MNRISTKSHITEGLMNFQPCCLRNSNTMPEARNVLTLLKFIVDLMKMPGNHSETFNLEIHLTFRELQ